MVLNSISIVISNQLIQNVITRPSWNYFISYKSWDPLHRNTTLFICAGSRSFRCCTRMACRQLRRISRYKKSSRWIDQAVVGWWLDISIQWTSRRSHGLPRKQAHSLCHSPIVFLVGYLLFFLRHSIQQLGIYTSEVIRPMSFHFEKFSDICPSQSGFFPLICIPVFDTVGMFRIRWYRSRNFLYLEIT